MLKKIHKKLKKYIDIMNIHVKMVANHMNLEVIIVGKKLKIEGNIENIKLIFCTDRNNLSVEKDSNMHEVGYGTAGKGVYPRQYYLYASKPKLSRDERLKISNWIDSFISTKAPDCTGFNFC